MIRFGGVLLLTLSGVLFAQDIDMQKIVVKESINTITVKDIGGKELKSADFADALSNRVPSVSIVRRNAIANDIILRGQKRDNINIIVDGAKIYGGCPNRMDPPTSHITTHTVENVQIKEGPFDVENFGTLSGLVNITTKEPKSGFGGEVNLGVGSFGYKKASASISGGNEKIKAFITISKETSDQYKDGNGDDFAKQLIKATDGTLSQGTQYQPKYTGMDAFEKRSLMVKMFANITQNQDLKFGYIGNRSKNILYPSSKMDAIRDDSDIFTFDYQIRDISKYSKVLDLNIYSSFVDHPMSIKYRKSALTKGMNITNHLESKMQGVKFKNSFDLKNTKMVIGLDASKREWDGKYYKDIDGDFMRFSTGEIKRSIDDIVTTNRAIFIKTGSKIKNIDLDSGIRYDKTTIKDDYSSLSANIFATYNISNKLRYFAGVGKSSRVPDARELYFTSMMAPNSNTFVGTPTLKQTTNYEIDFGFEKIYENSSIKTKFFYSMLKDYIYLNASKRKNIFENRDATIYGVEFSGVYLASELFYVNYALAYKRGKKDEPLDGQSDKDLAEITPLKANVTLEYEHDDSLNAKLDIIGVSKWSEFDSDNGEQPLDGYMILNFKMQKEFTDAFSISFGIDNILDKTYSTTNTYKDLTLITTGSEVDDVMLLNEPGRYLYLNATYTF